MYCELLGMSHQIGNLIVNVAISLLIFFSNLALNFTSFATLLDLNFEL